MVFFWLVELRLLRDFPACGCVIKDSNGSIFLVQNTFMLLDIFCLIALSVLALASEIHNLLNQMVVLPLTKGDHVGNSYSVNW